VHARLAEHWSKTENVEWSQEIPGRGWSSPIVTGGNVFVTTATTDGKSKPPQIGTEYSNEYVAELQKQGLSMDQILERVTARDIELPKEVTLHYFLYCLNLKSGKVEWKKEFYTGRPPGGRHRKNSFVSESPVTDGKLIYVYVANLGLWAFDLKGKPAWSTPLEANPIYLEFGTGSSPALAGNLLRIVSDNGIERAASRRSQADGKAGLARIATWAATAGAASGGQRSCLAAHAAQRSQAVGLGEVVSC
jgi:outer membrane protein assembly factor BamB